MPANTAQHFTHMSNGATCLYSLELQPFLQSLRATLADIDFEYESDIETVRKSSVDELFKQATIRKLQECHRERRMPCVVQLERLQKRLHARVA
ncbi:hypothetical protein [Microvirga sp. VF16]|uniref:hypothetical protein n=1 Tax=Microvirga sp. VF16 TaxID=2807101 RepID=UPI00193EC0B3|nr:hypothetical protein [Microvirga sp. VF16]QRM33513.1 hypothetical protein JO965_36360 [Microvirga sp. VF16]